MMNNTSSSIRVLETQNALRILYMNNLLQIKIVQTLNDIILHVALWLLTYSNKLQHFPLL